MSIVTYAIYNTTTGKISSVIKYDDQYGNELRDLNVGVGETYSLETDVDEKKHYYVVGSKTDRPLFEPTSNWNHSVGKSDGIDTLTFGSSLPTNAVCTIATPDASIDISDTQITTGSVSLTSNVSGDYSIRIEAFPYQEYVHNLTFVSGSINYVNVPNFSINVDEKIPTIISTKNNFIEINTLHLNLSFKEVNVISQDLKLVQVPKMTSISLGMKTPVVSKTENNLVEISNFNFIINNSIPSIISTKNNFINSDKFSIAISTYEPIINP